MRAWTCTFQHPAHRFPDTACVFDFLEILVVTFLYHPARVNNPPCTTHPCIRYDAAVDTLDVGLYHNRNPPPPTLAMSPAQVVANGGAATNGDAKLVLDESGVVTEPKLSIVDEITARRAKAGKFVAGLAAASNSDMFKGPVSATTVQYYIRTIR